MNHTTPHTHPWLRSLLCIGLLFTAIACSDDTSEESNPEPNTNNGTSSSTNNGTNTSTNNATNTSTGGTGTTTTPLDGELGVQVGDDSARSCEIMFQDPNNVLGDLRTDATVEGRSMRRGQRVAVAFAQTSDTAIANDAVRFVLSGDGNTVSIEQITCFDRAGQPLANPAIGLSF